MTKIKFTPNQQKVLNDKSENLLVSASAGSGKTAVLVERIINKIINEKINIDEILVVTFTNAAASEMRERILEAIYKKIEEDPANNHLQKQINLIRDIATFNLTALGEVKEVSNEENIDVDDNVI